MVRNRLPAQVVKQRTNTRGVASYLRELALNLIRDVSKYRFLISYIDIYSKFEIRQL